MRDLAAADPDTERRGAAREGSIRSVVLEISSVVALRWVAVVALLASGFRAISDDDYARTVIAEAFVATPKLDPSGTSWLPFPFHVMGIAMAIFGRSVEVARAASIAAATAAGIALHLALIVWKVPRHARLTAMLAVSVLPWTLWTTAATVPEASTAAFASAALLLAALPAERATRWTLLGAGGLVCAATLSRYEAWPVGVVVAAALAKTIVDSRGTTRRLAIAATILAVGGMVAWMSWNKLSHGSATHFLFRVARYKKAHSAGQEETSLLARVLAYPKLLVLYFPEALVAIGVLCATVRRRDGLLRARAFGLMAVALVMAFLVYGNLNDGVPTHHAERALLGAAFCAIPLGVAALAHRGTPRSWGAAAAVLLALELVHVCARERPGDGAANRDAQVARGRALRGAAHLTVTPCAYEHFALIAAFGAPEKVDIRPAEPSSVCPRARVPEDESSAPPDPPAGPRTR